MRKLPVKGEYEPDNMGGATRDEDWSRIHAVICCTCFSLIDRSLDRSKNSLILFFSIGSEDCVD